MTADEIQAVFGDAMPEVQAAAAKMADAIRELVPLMADPDGEGGAVRVGYALVLLGRRLAGVES